MFFSNRLKPNERLENIISDTEKDILPYDISIHFRSTDKVLESGIVEYQTMSDEIDRYLKKYSNKNIFLAADDGNFRKFLTEKYPEINFSGFDLIDEIPGQPRHFSDANPDEKALEALVNIFLLSRSILLIRTSSYLSSVSILLSENQISKTVNWTNTSDLPFPEKEIFAIESKRY